MRVARSALLLLLFPGGAARGAKSSLLSVFSFNLCPLPPPHPSLLLLLLLLAGVCDWAGREKGSRHIGSPRHEVICFLFSERGQNA